MEKKLESLGLTRNEAKIYLYLLKKGSTTTGAIIKSTKISNSRVYESLNILISKGLVTYNIQKKGKHFQAEDPEKFLILEEERKKKIEKLIPGLVKLKSIKEEETVSAVFEGLEGFRTAFDRIVRDCPERKTIYVVGFSKQAYAKESLRRIISKVHKERVAVKKHKIKILLDMSVFNEQIARDREKEKFTEVKYMPSGYISPGALDIFEDYVYIFLWDEKPFVFMIKNQKIADSFKTYFKFLWSMGKKRKEIKKSVP